MEQKNNDNELVSTTITLRMKHRKYIDRMAINLSKYMRQHIDKLIENE